MSNIKGGGRAVLSRDTQRALIDLLMSFDDEGRSAAGGGSESEHDKRHARKAFVRRLVRRHERRELRERVRGSGTRGDGAGGGGGTAANGAPPPSSGPSAEGRPTGNVRLELAEAIFDEKKKKKDKKSSKDKSKDKKRSKKSSSKEDSESQFRIGAKRVVVVSRSTTVKDLLRQSKSKLKLKKVPPRAFVARGRAVLDLEEGDDLSGLDDGSVVHVTFSVPDAGDAGGEPSDGEEEEEGDDFDPLDAVKAAYRVESTVRYRNRQRRDAGARGRRTPETFDAGRREAFAATRRRLPVHALREDILRSTENAVTVLSGTTGSGKSTQTPQFILEADGEADRRRPYIVVTQPRRVAAVSLARRVAEERGCPAPGKSGSGVGYIVRGDRRADLRSCRIIFVTIGVLLRMLVNDGGDGGAGGQTQDIDGSEEDDTPPPLTIHTISHLILDETHERDVSTDFALTLLRSMLASSSSPSGRKRHVPRLVLMSATASSEMFVDYLTVAGRAPSAIDVPGRIFPVATNWLRDCEGKARRAMDGKLSSFSPGGGEGRSRSDETATGDGDAAGLSPRARERIDDGFVVALIDRIVRDDRSKDGGGAAATGSGAILVFLPGAGEIESLAGAMKKSPGGGVGVCDVVKLHSGVPSRDQERAFRPPREGRVKVVLSTNIAETSVTIPDITHVIDTCRVKESRYNPSTRIRELTTVWTSRASMTQRAGRAGRTSGGTCWRLCPEDFAMEGMLDQTAPEMVRTPLDELILQILLLFEQRRDEQRMAVGCDGTKNHPPPPGARPLKFLSMTPTPPPERSLAQACRHLLDVEAVRTVDDGESFRLTPLGFHLSKLPMDAKVGKLLIVGCILGTLDNALTIAAALSCARSCFLPNFQGLDRSSVEARDSLIESGFGGKDWSGGTVKGDLIAVISVYRAWSTRQRSERGKFASDHALDNTALRDMETLRRQFGDLLAESGLIPERRVTPQDDGRGSEEGSSCSNSLAVDDALLTSCSLVAGLYPNIATLVRPQRPRQGGRLLTSDSSELCRPSSSSFQRRRVQQASDEGRDAYAVYHAKHRSVGAVSPGREQRQQEAFLSEVNFVSKFALILFGGRPRLVKNAIVVDNWLKFKVCDNDDGEKEKTNAIILIALRGLLDDVIVEHVVKTFATAEEKSRMAQRHEKIIEVVRRILADEG